uniref:Uncharacterized protein n=1 Tax=Anguilla anguilla TaxID=7936 RepID=A0A0E9RXB7_ANGAN
MVWDIKNDDSNRDYPSKSQKRRYGYINFYKCSE